MSLALSLQWKRGPKGRERERHGEGPVLTSPVALSQDHNPCHFLTAQPLSFCPTESALWPGEDLFEKHQRALTLHQALF